jgi:hypothetical protein
MKSEPVLIRIDTQQGFENEDYFGGHRNNPHEEFATVVSTQNMIHRITGQ